MAVLVAQLLGAGALEHVGEQADAAIVAQQDLVDAALGILVGQFHGALPQHGEFLVQVGVAETFVALALVGEVVHQVVLPVRGTDDALALGIGQSAGEEDGVGQGPVRHGMRGVVHIGQLEGGDGAEVLQLQCTGRVHGADAELAALLGAAHQQAAQHALADQRCHGGPLHPADQVVLQHQFLAGLQLGIQAHHFGGEAFLDEEHMPAIGGEDPVHHGEQVAGGTFQGLGEGFSLLHHGALCQEQSGREKQGEGDQGAKGHARGNRGGEGSGTRHGMRSQPSTRSLSISHWPSCCSRSYCWRVLPVFCWIISSSSSCTALTMATWP